jgi:hypothetical protein
MVEKACPKTLLRVRRVRIHLEDPVSYDPRRMRPGEKSDAGRTRMTSLAGRSGSTEFMDGMELDSWLLAARALRARSRPETEDTGAGGQREPRDRKTRRVWRGLLPAETRETVPGRPGQPGWRAMERPAGWNERVRAVRGGVDGWIWRERPMEARNGDAPPHDRVARAATELTEREVFTYDGPLWAAPGPGGDCKSHPVMLRIGAVAESGRWGASRRGRCRRDRVHRVRGIIAVCRCGTRTLGTRAGSELQPRCATVPAPPPRRAGGACTGSRSRRCG